MWRFIRIPRLHMSDLSDFVEESLSFCPELKELHTPSRSLGPGPLLFKFTVEFEGVLSKHRL